MIQAKVPEFEQVKKPQQTKANEIIIVSSTLAHITQFTVMTFESVETLGGEKSFLEGMFILTSCYSESVETSKIKLLFTKVRH